MALLIKKTAELDSSANFYTSSLNQHLLVVGLGNPGDRYAQTRHNIGWLCLDAWLRRQTPPGQWETIKKIQSLTFNNQIGSTHIRLLKPQTYMNLSGDAVSRALDYFRLEARTLLVVYDEITIKWGTIAIMTDAALSNHRGLISIKQRLGLTEFRRLAVGIGPQEPKSIDRSDFVLGRFSQQQTEELSQVTGTAADIISEASGGPLPPSQRRAIIEAA